MAELSGVIENIETRILKIDGPGGIRLRVASGQGTIEPGQVLAMNHNTGSLVKYNDTGSNGAEIAHTVFMEDVAVDTTDGTAMILCCRPGTTFNSAEIVGIDPAADYKAVADLFKSGICLEEVR